MIKITDTKDFISRLSHLLTAADHLTKAGVDTEEQSFTDLMASFLDQFHAEDEDEIKVISYVIRDKYSRNIQEIDGKIFYPVESQANFALGFNFEARYRSNYEVIPVFA